MLPDWLGGLLGFVGIPLVMWVWNTFASRESSVISGWYLTDLACKIFRQKLGLNNEGKPILERGCTTLDDMTFGARMRLRGDPKPTKEQLKERAKRANGTLIKATLLPLRESVTPELPY